MLFSVEQAFVGRDEKRAPLKTPAWEVIPSLKSYKSGQPRTSNPSNDFHFLFFYLINQSIKNKQRFRGSTSTFLVQLEFGNVCFRERGKPEYMYQGNTSLSS